MIAYGAQDVYLTSNPQITFSKWFIEDTQIFQLNQLNKPLMGQWKLGQDVSITIQRNADLVYKMYFQTTVPSVNVSYGLEAATSKWSFI